MMTAVRSARQPAATSRGPRSEPAPISHCPGVPAAWNQATISAIAASSTPALQTTPLSALECGPERTAKPSPSSRTAATGDAATRRSHSACAAQLASASGCGAGGGASASACSASHAASSGAASWAMSGSTRAPAATSRSAIRR